jgi:hypothetical protein
LTSISVGTRYRLARFRQQMSSKGRRWYVGTTMYTSRKRDATRRHTQRRSTMRGEREAVFVSVLARGRVSCAVSSDGVISVGIFPYSHSAHSTYILRLYSVDISKMLFLLVYEVLYFSIASKLYFCFSFVQSHVRYTVALSIDCSAV